MAPTDRESQNWSGSPVIIPHMSPQPRRNCNIISGCTILLRVLCYEVLTHFPREDFRGSFPIPKCFLEKPFILQFLLPPSPMAVTNVPEDNKTDEINVKTLNYEYDYEIK